MIKAKALKTASTLGPLSDSATDLDHFDLPSLWEFSSILLVDIHKIYDLFLFVCFGDSNFEVSNVSLKVTSQSFFLVFLGRDAVKVHKFQNYFGYQAPDCSNLS